MLSASFLFIVHWYTSLFCQSFFLHRYSSHRMFHLTPFWEKFFYLMTFVTQGPSFLNPRSYSILHQKHHLYSDKKLDPHSPQHSPNPWKMMLKTYDEYKSILKNKDCFSDDKIEKHYPEWKLIDDLGENQWSLIGWGIFYILIYQFLNVPWYGYFLLPLHYFIGPIQGAIVNWCGHKYGYVNFENKDQSKNSLFVDLILMGELYQNNHHHNAKRLNFAYRWFEVDLTYMIVKILKRFQIIKGL